MTTMTAAVACKEPAVATSPSSTPRPEHGPQAGAKPDAGTALTFVAPLLGFEGVRRFLLARVEDGPLWWLVGEGGSPRLCLLDPFAAGLDPDIAIEAADAADLGASAAGDLAVYTVVVLDRDPARARTNLRAPIVVNRATGMAKQVVLADAGLPVRLPLKQALERGRRPL